MVPYFNKYCIGQPLNYHGVALFSLKDRILY